MKTLALLCALPLILAAAPAARAGDTAITDFAKNANLRQNVGVPLDDGSFTAANGFATPFTILSDAQGNNFAIINPNALTVQVGLFGATDVYTLINGFNPYVGDAMTQIDAYGSGGAHDVFTLVNGTDVRDFNNYIYADTINGTTTQNAFSGQGPDGPKVLDEQHLALSSDFAAQTLTELVFTNLDAASGRNPGSFPFLSAITVHTAAVTPEPGTALPFALGALALVGLARRAKARAL